MALFQINRSVTKDKTYFIEAEDSEEALEHFDDYSEDLDPETTNISISTNVFEVDDVDIPE